MKPQRTLRALVVLALVGVLGSAAVLPAAADVELGYDVRFSGVIKAVGEAGQDWVIGGQTVVTNADTHIVLTVSPAKPGLWADVAAVRLENGSLVAKQIIVRPEQVRLRGIVTTILGDKVGAWVIAGVTVKVTANTKISNRGGAVAVGKWVEAVMTEDAGVLTATHIVGMGAQDSVMVSGEIRKFGATEWVISGIRLAVNAETLISGTPVVGLIGSAAADLQDDGTLLAKGLRVAWIDRSELPFVADFTGRIETLPDVGLRGAWTVDGETVYVLPNTRIHQEKGLAVVGAAVHVIGVRAEGKVLAREITVIDSPEEGGQYVLSTGVIESLPADVKNGIWAIFGQRVLVNDRTTLQGMTPEVGRTARYEGVKRASDGVVVASIVRVVRVITPSVPARP